MNEWHCAYVDGTHTHTRKQKRCRSFTSVVVVLLLGACFTSRGRGHAIQYRRADQHKMLAWRSTYTDDALEKCVRARVRAFVPPVK